jgi:HK97 family phage major capsid protein
MAIYDQSIDRVDAGSTIPPDHVNEVIKTATEKSAVLSMFTRKTMTRLQQTRPVLDAKPYAYFVNPHDTGLKQTTDVKWSTLTLNAEPIAVIVPIPDDVVADSGIDLWAEIKPELTEAVAAVIDNAVFFGLNRPTTWPVGIFTGATNAGNTVTATTPGAGTPDTFDDLNTAMTQVETDGYTPRRWVISPSFKGVIRNTRDANKGFLYPPSGPANTGGADAGWAGSIWNVPAFVSMLGMAGFSGTPTATAFLLDTSMFYAAVREDIRFEMFKEGVITDGAGAVLVNLMQQDMKAVRVVMRLAWQVANPANRVNPTAATRYPASVVKPA